MEQKCSTIPLLAAFSSYCQRSVATYKGYGDCISVNTVDQLRSTRKAAKAVRFCAKVLVAARCFAHARQDFDDAMKTYKSSEQEVGKKDKKLKDIENSKSAANQRSTIDSLSRQLQDERKVTCPSIAACVCAGVHRGCCRHWEACATTSCRSGRGVWRSTRRVLRLQL